MDVLMREKLARALCWQDELNPDYPSGSGKYWEHYLPQVDAVLATLAEPDEGMLRLAVVQTDLTDAHFDKAAAVLEGMPPLAPDRQQEGLRAVADLYRDWQAMIAATRLPGVGGE